MTDKPCAFPGCTNFDRTAVKFCTNACSFDYPDWGKVRFPKVAPAPLDCGEWDRSVPTGIGWTEHKCSLQPMIEEVVAEFCATYHRKPRWMACVGIATHILMAMPFTLISDRFPECEIDLTEEWQHQGGYFVDDDTVLALFVKEQDDKPTSRVYIGDDRATVVFDIVGEL